MGDWNAQLYNRFQKERRQPVIDLMNRLNKISGIKRIIDIGCGTGISTIPLQKQWTDATIIGVDNSESMLSKAKEENKDILWINRDCNKSLQDLGKFDLVFSNAALQWLPDQEGVIRNLGNLLTDNGVLAVQIPNFPNMTISLCIQKAVNNFIGTEFDGIDKELCICYNPEYYYDVLSKYFHEIELWQTNYYHIMNSHEEILEFYKSTGLRPYLERLNSTGQEKFLSEVLAEIKSQYHIQKDRKVLFEFKRIFFLAKQYENPNKIEQNNFS